MKLLKRDWEYARWKQASEKEAVKAERDGRHDIAAWIRNVIDGVGKVRGGQR